MQFIYCRLPVVIVLAWMTLPVCAYEVTDRFFVSGILAGAGQCQDVSTRLPADSYAVDGVVDSYGHGCRGAMPLQVEAGYHPDGASEFFIKFGFAEGNGLNEASPWVLAPWAADLEDNVKDINGGSRDYLLAAWYRHTFRFAGSSALAATVGILDSTDYLDGNEYANNEYTQFMNETLVNSGSYGLPSYDAGAALGWVSGPWTVNAMAMDVAENDDDRNYKFWGIQTAYRAETRSGTGNYRLILAGTSSAFSDTAGAEEESLLAWGLSFDQEITPVVGAFLRVAWQQEDAAVDYAALYSGGLNFKGSGWGRDSDNIGVGYAYLDGGNVDIANTRVFETYYRFSLNEAAGLTADVQYMEDRYNSANPVADDPAGWIFGLRVTAGF